MQRAQALEARYRFRYSLSALARERIADWDAAGADVLTDDFAPADLYRMTPVRAPRRP